MSLILIALATAQIGATQPVAQPPALECRRAGSSNGARVGRKICKASSEWKDDDRQRFMTFGVPGSGSTVGDPDNRTMSRPLQLR